MMFKGDDVDEAQISCYFVVQECQNLMLNESCLSLEQASLRKTFTQPSKSPGYYLSCSYRLC